MKATIFGIPAGPRRVIGRTTAKNSNSGVVVHMAAAVGNAVEAKTIFRPSVRTFLIVDSRLPFETLKELCATTTLRRAGTRARASRPKATGNAPAVICLCLSFTSRPNLMVLTFPISPRPCSLTHSFFANLSSSLPPTTDPFPSQPPRCQLHGGSSLTDVLRDETMARSGSGPRAQGTTSVPHGPARPRAQSEQGPGKSR